MSLSNGRHIPDGAETANCKRCQETPVPSSFASKRKCAFDGSGIFTNDNWNCVTAIKLRTAAGESMEDKRTPESMYVRRDDQSYAAIWIPPHPEDVPDGNLIGVLRGGGFIAMTWYKNRGRTDIMIRVDPRNGGTLDQAGLPLTAEEAEEALINLKLAKAMGQNVKLVV